MAAPAFNFGTGSFDAQERGIRGSTSIAPLVELRIGGALWRAIYTYRNTGIVLGALGSGFPTVTLLPMNVNARWTVIPVLSPVVWPDAVDGYDYFDASADAENDYIVGFDPTFGGGRPACPEIKTWCEALGGTYTGL